MNMATDFMEVKMYESAIDNVAQLGRVKQHRENLKWGIISPYIFTKDRLNRFCISFIETAFSTMLNIGIRKGK
jgi:hypothetical protein